MPDIKEIQTSLREVVLADIKATLDALESNDIDTAADMASSGATTLGTIADDLSAMADELEDE